MLEKGQMVTIKAPFGDDATAHEIIDVMGIAEDGTAVDLVDASSFQYLLADSWYADRFLRVV